MGAYVGYIVILCAVEFFVCLYIGIYCRNLSTFQKLLTIGVFSFILLIAGIGIVFIKDIEAKAIAMFISSFGGIFISGFLGIWNYSIEKKGIKW